MDKIIFKKLEWKDIDRFIELRKSQLNEEGMASHTDITASLLDYYERHFADGTFVSWVATYNDVIIATSGMSFVEHPPHYGNPSGRIGVLSSMYTTKPFRRKGIAKKLLELVINEAREHGCGALHITASDAGALLYQNYGFERHNNFFRYKLI